MEQEYSHLFVVVMGMGVTFVGLTAIIYLTQFMGFIITKLEKSKPKEAVPAPAPAPVAVPAMPADDVPDEVKVAIIAALAQEPGFRMDRVTRIDIRKV